MSSPLFRLLPVVLIAAWPAASASGQQCPAEPGPYRAIVDDLQSRQRNVGVAVAVLANGRLAYEGYLGLADREAGRAVGPETRFGVASITKAFTGLALLRLAEEGKIDLDAPIQRYVPEFPRHEAGEVTLRHLAAHLGGVRHWGRERNADLYARHLDDVTEILALFRDDPWVRAPGTGYSYSSYGYNLLAMAIQRASGQRYQEYVRSRVIEPLGLAATAFDDPRRRELRDAVRYSYYDLSDYHELTTPVRVPDWDYSHNMGGGNMVATARDLARFGRAVRSPGLLSPESHAMLVRRPRIGGVESPMSFGWFVRTEGPPRLAISGSNAGLQAGLVTYLDADLVVATVANSWGIGSRSAEFVDDGPKGLIGRLAALCMAARPG